MTDPDDLRQELREIDRRIDQLSAQDTRFDLGREIRKLKTRLFPGADATVSPNDRFTSKRERVERIRELQRRRETVLERLAARSETADDSAAESRNP